MKEGYEKAEDIFKAMCRVRENTGPIVTMHIDSFFFIALKLGN